MTIDLLELCLFVKFATCTTYRAIYLEELCLTSLITNVCQKLHLDTSQINQVLWVVSDKNNLIVHVDDTVVQDIPDNQDMEINTTTNQNGTINLLLYY